jgi:hypothetical protein
MRLGVVCHLLLLSLSVIIGWHCQSYFPIVSPHCSLFLSSKQLLTVVVGGRPHCLELPGHCCVCVCCPCHCPHHVPVSVSISIPISISISIPIPVFAPPNPFCEQLLTAEVGVLGHVCSSGHGLTVHLAW